MIESVSQSKYETTCPITIKKSGNWGLDEINCHRSHKGQCTSEKENLLKKNFKEKKSLKKNMKKKNLKKKFEKKILKKNLKRENV